MSTGSGPPPAESTDEPTPLHFWRFTGPVAWPRSRRSPFSGSTSSWSPSCAAPGGGDLHRRDPVPGGRAIRQRGHHHGRPASIHRNVRPRRPPAANRVYQATTAWLILLTWPLYLLAVVFGPGVLSVFGHSYRAGAAVMVILGLTMLLQTACGQVDMVLVTAGRSSWSLINGLLAVGVNVGLDVAADTPLRDHRRGDRLVRRDRCRQPHAARPVGADRAVAPIRARYLHRRGVVCSLLRRSASGGARAARPRRHSLAGRYRLRAVPSWPSACFAIALTCSWRPCRVSHARRRRAPGVNKRLGEKPSKTCRIN